MKFFAQNVRYRGDIDTMNISKYDRIRKVFCAFILGVTEFFLGAGTGSALTAGARLLSVRQVNPYYTVTTSMLPDGNLIEEDNINGPPSPPPGFELDRQAVLPPEPGIAAASLTLTVPAFDWVFGCSSVSGAMIAGYYDRNGYPNMYTGPTNGGVMPLNTYKAPGCQETNVTRSETRKK